MMVLPLQFSHLFDNESTVFFALFMGIWGEYKVSSNFVVFFFCVMTIHEFITFCLICCVICVTACLFACFLWPPEIGLE